MKTKRKEKIGSIDTKPSVEQIQTDHEMFLQAYEKPTQIYRFLRCRHLVHPVFLHRTLGYMKGRCQRNNSSRVKFRVDCILQKAGKQEITNGQKLASLTLNILGFYNKNAVKLRTVELDTYLIKKCNSRRKLRQTTTELPISKVRVVCNPDYKANSRVSVVLDNSYLSDSVGCKIQFRVRCKSTHDEPDVLPAKRRRSRVVDDATVNHSPVPALAEEPAQPEQLYSTEFDLYEGNEQTPLPDGEYQLVMAEHGCPAAAASQSAPSWHTVGSTKHIDNHALFQQCPTLKFKLSWHPSIEKDTALVSKTKMALDSNQNITKSPTKRRRIFYQFLYTQNSRQQTEARDDLTCPWCLLQCPQLYSLLKHLRMCHPRFLFLYSEHPKGARIDVSINEHYDGSYSGNPYDLYSYMGFAYCRNHPVQRMSVTQVLVYRPTELSSDLSEFTENDMEENHRPLVQGHDRLYYHTMTSSVQWPSEIECDSDSEMDPQWLQQKTEHLIDDFTDVNEGEKEIMKMWNLLIMHHNFIGDYQLARACALFVSEYGSHIIHNHLERNLMLHLINLYDHGLIKPELIERTMMQLFRLRIKLQATDNEMTANNKVKI